MSTILINNVLLNGKQQNVLISGNKFTKISEQPIAVAADEVIDGSHFAIVPPFYNGHCHAAMVLLRGYADDMPLQKWLNESIWPMEAKMTADDIYSGSRLAILEMIKSGTVYFSDMYWEEQTTAQAAEELGIRASIGVSVMDRMGEDALKASFAKLKSYKATDLVNYTIAPHAIYTVGTDLLRRSKEAAEENDVYLNIHLSETIGEIEACKKEHNGMSPVQYLDSLGLLTPKAVLAHVVHVDDADMNILAERQSVCVHNPASNMKLSSGAFKMKEMQQHGCKVVLGTDGASSNNNLDMLEEMKLTALLAKCFSGDPESGNANYVFDMATRIGAEAFGYNAGVIAEGKLADALLIDLNNEKMTPHYNIISDLVYSADSSCIDTVICNGRVVMKNHYVDGEEQIIESARKTCYDLLNR